LDIFKIVIILNQQVPHVKTCGKLLKSLLRKGYKTSRMRCLIYRTKRKPSYCNAEVGGGRACGRAGVNFWFPLNNFGLLWPIDTKLVVWVAYIKTQLWIATHVSVINVKVTVTKNRNSVSAQ